MLGIIRRLSIWLPLLLILDGCAGADVAPLDQDGGALSGDGQPFQSRPAVQTCSIPPAPPVGTMELSPAFPGLELTRPVWLGTAPGEESTYYAVEQSGRIIAFQANAPEQSQVFFERLVYRDNNEEGLLGLAFHPDFTENGRLFLFYSMSNPRRAVISEYQRNRSAPDSVDPTSERILLEVEQPFGNHNGGDIKFGPDGYLYISIGDGGAAADPFEHGQNRNTLLGTILRIDVDTRDPACGTPYGIPADNPFAGERCQPGVEPAGAPEVWAWGLRNVWRMSFDRGTGALWAGDVGQDAWEEVNLIRGGENYGWRTAEGNTCFREDCNLTNYTAPVHVYGHDVGKSITGGFVYRGTRFPELWGHYIFGDYETGRLWALEAVEEPGEATLIALSRARIASFGESPAGELYVVTFDQGILTLQRSQQTNQFPPIPETLTGTGCFSDVPSHQLAPGVYPYQVRVPFWSDGLSKERAVALPTNTTLTLRADGSMNIPIGAVALKTFTKTDSNGATRRVETRIIRRDAKGWNGYSYLWRADQTEADLLTGRTELMVETEFGAQVWTIPSRSECDHCHIDRLGYALGLVQKQLDFEVPYEMGLMNQLDAMATIDLVTRDDAMEGVRAHPSLMDETSSIAERARAMLSINCAPCHQPDGPADAEIDLRSEIPLNDMKVCNVEPLRGDVDIPNAMLVNPGDPGHSLLLRRMQIREKGQMPPLGSHRVDPAGTDLVMRWIAGLQDCTTQQAIPE